MCLAWLWGVEGGGSGSLQATLQALSEDLALPSDTAPWRGDTVFLGWMGLKEGPGEPLGCPASSAEGNPPPWSPKM